MQRRSLLTTIAALALSFALPGLALAQSAGPNPQVIIKTAQGDITVRLFKDKAPLTVENFLKYVDEGYYNGTIFHRVIPDFMVQGGGFTPDMVEKPTRNPIKNESRNRVHNVRGTVAMARTSDPDSATAQFFINHRTNLELDWKPGQEGYTVFGEVTDGMSLVDFFTTAPVQRLGPHENVPLEPIVINEIVRKSYL